MRDRPRDWIPENGPSIFGATTQVRLLHFRINVLPKVIKKVAFKTVCSFFTGETFCTFLPSLLQRTVIEILLVSFQIGHPLQKFLSLPSRNHTSLTGSVTQCPHFTSEVQSMFITCRKAFGEGCAYFVYRAFIPNVILYYKGKKNQANVFSWGHVLAYCYFGFHFLSVCLTFGGKSNDIGFVPKNTTMKTFIRKVKNQFVMQWIIK